MPLSGLSHRWPFGSCLLYTSTEEGGVSLITEYDNGVLTLVVEDTGTGMTEEEQKQAFVINIFCS